MLDLEQLLRVRSAYAGRFDAGGKHLAFVADISGVPQVWAISDKPWPDLVVSPPDRAQTLYPGPRPGQLVVGADVGGDEHTQLLYVDRLGGSWRALTADPDHIHNFGSFSTDGRQIGYASNTRSGRWFDVYVCDLASDATRVVLEDDSTNRAGPFSPDGRWLIVTRAFSSSHHELWLVDLAAGSSPRLLTRPGEEATYEHVQWSPDGRSVYCLTDRARDLAVPACIDVATCELSLLVQPEFEVDEIALDAGTRRLAYALNRDGENEIVVRDLATGAETHVGGLPPGALHSYWQSGLAWDAAGERLAISWSASRINPNVFVWSEDASEARQATFASGLDVNVSELPEPQHVTYPSFDGRQIPAVFYPAAGGRSGACVVFVHGGPEGQYRPTFQPIVQYLASAGLSVLATNVRGSTGYGRAFAHLDDVRKRMDSVADLAHAAYWLRDSGRADPRRIAVYGGSYGGFMVLAALTNYPELWAAGVDLVGISNFVTFLENTGPWRRHLREAEYGSLEQDREFLEQISPINKVDAVRAPLFVIHGANDPRVPIGETEQMVARLRALGRTVEFLRLEDEGHQISKLANKLAVYPRAVEFLQRHLDGGR
jgi:dipeptidyl aminopeptidase/acylaminoacyl peptidase